MDFAFSPAEERLRARVRAFIAKVQARQAGPDSARLQRALPGDAPWRAISWPAEWGGQGRTVVDQFIVEEEFCRAGYRIGSGGTAAPHVLAWGTEDQRRKLLPPLLRGELLVAPAFTEPQCGTDLAAVQMSAAAESGGYRLRGTKAYISAADVATHFMLLARTDPASQRHSGLSVFVVPADTPGIRVDPMPTLHADAAPPPGTIFGEQVLYRVTFTDVRVPASCRLGSEGEGWQVVSSRLGLDQVSARSYVGYVQQDEQFVAWLRTSAGAHSRQDAVVRDAVGELWIEREVCRLLAMRTLSKAAAGEPGGTEALVENAWGPQHCIRATERISQALGPAAQVLRGSPGAIQNGLFAHNLLGAFQSAVHHGGVSVMRDLLAKALGLVQRPRTKE